MASRKQFDYRLNNGRMVGTRLVALHIRIVIEDGAEPKVTLGIDQKGGGVSWQLSIIPEAGQFVADCIEEALAAADPSRNAHPNAVDGGREAT